MNLKKESRETMNSQQTEKTFQKYLDSDPYSQKNIAIFEKIFGKSYVSPGGEESATCFSRLLELGDGQKVIDIACGAGGPAFLMARYYWQ